MLNRENWKLAIDALRVNKVTSGLTMLGVLIGSSCIVLVVTTALIGKNFVVNQIEGVGSNLVYASYHANEPKSPADEISIHDLEVVRGLPHVVAVAGTRDVNDVSIFVNGKESPVTLLGVTEDFQKVRNLWILRGRFFDAVDMNSDAKACLITETLANRFRQDMIGQMIRVGELRFTVIGVFRERLATLGLSVEIASDSVLIPFPLVKYYKGNEFLGMLHAQADSPQTTLQVTDGVRHVLQSSHRRGLVYTVENLSALLEAARSISTVLTAVLALLACVSLVVSGVGIMNIMLVTVSERTREIGVRKAVGAKRTDILHQFLIEAILISGIGALLGISGAAITTIVLQPLVTAEYSVHIPLSSVSMALSFTVSCATGILFGYIPARRASKLLPIEALGHE